MVFTGVSLAASFSRILDTVHTGTSSRQRQLLSKSHNEFGYIFQTLSTGHRQNRAIRALLSLISKARMLVHWYPISRLKSSDDSSIASEAVRWPESTTDNEMIVQSEPQNVAWRCVCGKQFVESYTEKIPGGIVRLRQRLYRSRTAKLKTFWRRLGEYLTMCTSTRQPEQGNKEQSHHQLRGSICQSQPERSRTLELNNSSSNDDSAKQTPSLDDSSSVTKIQSSESGIVSYLLLCLPDTLCGLKLRHQQLIFSKTITNGARIHTDRQLFLHLQKLYQESRNKIASTLAFKTIDSVSFAKFRVTLSEYVDLYPHASMCKTTSGGCNCFPPKAKLVQYPWQDVNPQAEYWCNPIDFEVIPPISSAYLAHCFQSPQCINEAETWVLDQLPKRLKGELKATSGKFTAIGWGLTFQEGWNISRIRYMVGGMLAGTLLFGALWATFQRDVQGAFSISACLIAALAVVISFVGLTEPRIRN